jgi:hypothetical protein
LVFPAGLGIKDLQPTTLPMLLPMPSAVAASTLAGGGSSATLLCPLLSAPPSVPALSWSLDCEQGGQSGKLGDSDCTWSPAPIRPGQSADPPLQLLAADAAGLNGVNILIKWLCFSFFSFTFFSLCEVHPFTLKNYLLTFWVYISCCILF